MEVEQEPLDIVSQAFCMAAVVERFMEQARAFYYAVMLSGYPCPGCGGSLEMVSEGTCQCHSCGSSFDPTVTFQRCEGCGGKPRLMVRRYQCSCCGQDVASRFLFDGLVFDAEYFRQKMAESRERKRELRERVRQMLTQGRSPAIQPEPMDLAAMPGLLEALDGLVRVEDGGFDAPLFPAFSLSRYQSHIHAHIRPFPMRFDQIPPLSENTRLDRIWRFIAILFLAHAGIIDAWQNGPDILVMKREIGLCSINTGPPGIGSGFRGASGWFGFVRSSGLRVACRRRCVG
ncbi:MAG TPA: hypothetical protein PKY77_26150 [Phycisphaerae bacterium]|nr:hypothetical protein [Phycisphaerae bacterium]HSA29975.1 hypothetical protein [Phycisphaerae bacterium]